MQLLDMPWLPRPMDDFRARCREISGGVAGAGAMIRGLAGHALDLNQLTLLAKAIGRARADDMSVEGLTPLRLALLSNGTTSLLVPALIATAARYGFLLDVVEAPFDQATQVALDPESEINSSSPDVVLLAFDQHILPLPTNMADRAEAVDCIEATVARIDSIRNGVAAASGATVILQTMPPPPAHTIGSYDLQLPGSPGRIAAAVNAHLVDAVHRSGNLLLDVGGLAQMIGLHEWHDPLQWYMAKLAFSQNAVPLYADHVARLLAAWKGESRKCLVLDLDNTLWGGVIGDDGVGGISLGQGNPVGEAHLAVQAAALELRRLGVILAVSSKNDDATARGPFLNHPDMLMRESDIAVFQANWSDKATNLEVIAATLKIGVDSLVLLDDNPAERAQVREALPMVAVPELPDDPAQFARTLLAAGYFETVSLSQEDLIRADDYGARARRIELQGKARSLDSYLESLEMEIVFAAFDETGRSRIAQLTNKSNQFNLTTRRYSEKDITEIANDPAAFTLQVRLRDRFGDNGMISVLICWDVGDAWEIDTWLMSCRVLGRGVEHSVLAELVRHGKSAGKKSLIGRFIPSGKNEMVRDHYKKLGFVGTGEHWRLDFADFKPRKVHMRIIDSVS
ncbi:MAG: HAD-IIIC family phosphatase [Rhodospirillaceae bacterium]|nr:MAG: HAD-IIIC family phosphatase [Rhodospirillaceae bacterium]